MLETSPWWPTNPRLVHKLITLCSLNTMKLLTTPPRWVTWPSGHEPTGAPFAWQSNKSCFSLLHPKLCLLVSICLSKCMEVGNTIPRWAAMFSFKFIIVEKGQWIWWTVSSLPQSVPLTNQACVHTSSHMQYTSLQQKHQNSSDWIHCCLFIEQITDWMSAVPLCSLLRYGWSTS